MENEQAGVPQMDVAIGINTTEVTTGIDPPIDVHKSDKPTLDEDQAMDDGVNNGYTIPEMRQSSAMTTANEQKDTAVSDDKKHRVAGAAATGPELIQTAKEIMEQGDHEK
jgi:hypothetical protein